jgi:hypothetical protein
MESKDTLDDTLLEQFMSRFLGYGSFNARFWFIGMEEGGGNDFEQVSKRLETWRSRGMRELEDVRDYHLAIGIDRFFREPIKIQRTWAHLVRVYLSALGHSIETEDIKKYQAKKLGRQDGDTAILELMPLCSPGTGYWFYDRWSDLPYLKSREQYELQVMPNRIALLKNKLQTNQPKVVVFYGVSYREYYEETIGARTNLISELDCYSCDIQSTRYLIIKHPAAKGITNQYFINIGKSLSRYLIE